MPTGQNPVQPTTQATKYYKSLSLLFLLLLLPRERLVASPGNAQRFKSRGLSCARNEQNMGASPPKTLGPRPFMRINCLHIDERCAVEIKEIVIQIDGIRILKADDNIYKVSIVASIILEQPKRYFKVQTKA